MVESYFYLIYYMKNLYRFLYIFLNKTVSHTKVSTRLTLSCNFTSQTKRTSRLERCRDISISLRLPWAAQ